MTAVAAQAADKAVSQKLMPVAVGLDASGNATQWGVQIPSSGFPYWLFQGLSTQAGSILANLYVETGDPARAEPILIDLLAEPAIDHQANPPVATAPRQVRHNMVVEQPTRFADGFKVTLHRREESLGELRTSRARRDVALQAFKVRGKVTVVLAEELHHPGRLVELVEAVLQRIFQTADKCTWTVAMLVQVRKHQHFP